MFESKKKKLNQKKLMIIIAKTPKSLVTPVIIDL